MWEPARALACARSSPPSTGALTTLIAIANRNAARNASGSHLAPLRSVISIASSSSPFSTLNRRPLHRRNGHPNWGIYDAHVPSENESGVWHP